MKPSRARARVFAVVAATAMLALACAPAAEEKDFPIRVPIEEGKLAGRLLVASPKMPDPRFSGTVVFLVRHDDGGAFGVVVNRAVGVGPAAKLLEGIDDAKRKVAGDGRIRIHYGGPVRPRQGFVLHSSDFAVEGTVAVTDQVSMTTNPEILRRIAADNGPSRHFIAMGYAGWGPGQLEDEIRRKDWVTVTADEGIVLDDDMRTKWRRAMARRGVDL